MSRLTERALIEAFFKLLKKMPLKKIKVSDITAECGVNRMTFYYHFENINNLIEKAFEARFIGSSEEEISASNWRESYLELHRAVYDSRELVRKVYPEFDVRELISFLKPIAHRYVVAATDGRLSCLEPAERERICAFFQSAIVGEFLLWLEGNLTESPEQRVNEATDMLERCLGAAIDACDKK